MPLDDTGILARGADLCADGHFAEASNLLRPVAECELANLDIWRLLARAELAAERYASALQAAEHTHVLAPAEALSDMIASFALLKLGRTEEALERARRAVMTDPHDFAAVSLLARMLSVAGFHDEARAVAADAAELAPDRPEAHLTAGIVAAAAGKRDAARVSFREVLALDPASGAAHHELARLRLRRRVNDPAALADAASGFARAANTDSASQRSVWSLEKVLRTFLSKTAYLLFLDAYLVGRVSASSNGAAARLVPVALLGVPAYYGARFLRQLTPTPRQRLAWLLIGERVLSIATALEGISVASILAASVLAASLRSGVAAVAALAAFAARLMLYLARERAARSVSSRPAEHAIRAGLIWVIASLLGLLAVALIVAAVMRDRPGAAIGALVCLVGAGALAQVAIRRRISG
jgi:tetratricopeptide (TPR) repeat protein